MLRSTLRLTRASIRLSFVRRFADVCGEGKAKKGLILGAYDGCNPGELKLTPSGKKFDEEGGGKLSALLKGAKIGRGTAEVYTGLHQDYAAVAVTGLGQEGEGMDTLENLDRCKENIRIAAGVAAAQLQSAGMNTIFVEGFTNPEAAAEGAALALWKYQEFKNKDEQTGNTKLELYEDPDREAFQRGLLKAEAQNIARGLEEAPANHMTPTIFAQKAIDILCPCGVQVDVRDRDWLETKKMFTFLSMSKGSCESPLFLEIGYCAAPPAEKPVLFTAKGVTFDTGGLCTKNKEGMMEHRADMAGAAVLVGVFKCVASMNLPINMNALIPLCENMPGGLAVKPGDVMRALNGKSIRVEDTDNEGRVILSDPLCYSSNYDPCLVMTIGTLSGAMTNTLGNGCSGVFTTSNVVWRELNRAGAETGDRVWRLPMWKYYQTKVTSYIGVDVNNVGKGDGGGPCLAAAFLNEFVPPNTDFCHLDITGVGMNSPGIGYPYLKKDLMTGRPTRTIIQFLYQMVCPHEKGDEC